MKSILKSLKPQIISNILNGKQTVLVCKQFPKDYVGWVYVYCTKSLLYGDEYLCKENRLNKYQWFEFMRFDGADMLEENEKHYILNGKVVARFWCDKVEEITTKIWTPTKERKILSASCLTESELFDYIDESEGKPFNAIHISKLEIFDRPKCLDEFSYRCSSNKDCSKCEYGCEYYSDCYSCGLQITTAPQNYCYVESEE